MGCRFQLDKLGMIKTILIDYDNTLHDSNSKFIIKFNVPTSKLGLSLLAYLTYKE